MSTVATPVTDIKYRNKRKPKLQELQKPSWPLLFLCRRHWDGECTQTSLWCHLLGRKIRQPLFLHGKGGAAAHKDDCLSFLALFFKFVKFLLVHVYSTNTMIIFSMGSWCTYTAHLNSFYFRFFIFTKIFVTKMCYRISLNKKKRNTVEIRRWKTAPHPMLAGNFKLEQQWGSVTQQLEQILVVT